MPSPPCLPRLIAVLILASSGFAPVQGGFLYQGLSPTAPPWPGGIIPYVIDPALSAPRRKAYLDGIREWELAGNLHFIPRTTESQYVLFKYDPSGPNRVSGSHPQVVEVNSLTRSQICHEMGHSLGLDHEHIRPDRDTFVSVQTANISPGNAFWFDIQPAGLVNGVYDFESVMHFGRDLFSIQPGVLDTLSPKPGFERHRARMGNFALSPGDRAAIAWLYGPAVLSPVVTTTADTGPGSLRAALYHAASHPGTTITFNIPVTDPGHFAGVFTIRPTGHLPPLVSDGTRVDGSTQPGYAGNPRIFIDGADILSESGDPPGLMIYAADCVVRGLAFTRSRWVGVAILHPDATGNQICSCWSGVAPGGSTAHGHAKQGVQISEGASDNLIGPDNVLSGNTEYGVWISGATTTGNTVSGSRIGTTADGSAALANGLGGVIVTGGASFSRIGPDNVISGNQNTGVWIAGADVVNNSVTSNLIGTDATGTAAVPNSFAGIHLLAGASDNVVTDNVVSGNGAGFGYGIVLTDPGSEDNSLSGNLIGALRGGGALGNRFAGIGVWNGAKDNVITGNLIAHNDSIGIAMYDAATTGHTFRANSIHSHAFAGIAIGPANHAQPAPVLVTATAGAAGLTLSGTIDGPPSSAHRIEFFSSPAPGDGSGRVFLGAMEGVATGVSGTTVFSTTLPAAPAAGRVITATSTHTASGDTSVFSAPLAASFTDGDLDGMPDFFEVAHSLNPAADDASADADGDGSSNLAEYLAGTHPRNAGDLLKALSIQRGTEGLTLTFRTVAGRSYQLQESSTLIHGSWRVLVPLRTADSELLQFTVSADAERAFHRLVLLD